MIPLIVYAIAGIMFGILKLSGTYKGTRDEGVIDIGFYICTIPTIIVIFIFLIGLLT